MVEQHITSIFRGIRRNSEYCVERFAEIHAMDGMPGVLVVRNSLKASDPVEVEVYSNYDLLPDPGVSYTQKPRRR